jgi:uncharacterized protein
MELIVTYRCNLACDYCFMRKQNLCHGQRDSASG